MIVVRSLFVAVCVGAVGLRSVAFGECRLSLGTGNQCLSGFSKPSRSRTAINFAFPAKGRQRDAFFLWEYEIHGARLFLVGHIELGLFNFPKAGSLFVFFGPTPSPSYSQKFQTNGSGELPNSRLGPEIRYTKTTKIRCWGFLWFLCALFPPLIRKTTPKTFFRGAKDDTPKHNHNYASDLPVGPPRVPPSQTINHPPRSHERPSRLCESIQS